MTSLLPIVHRELLLASRRRGTYWTRCCTAALVGGVLFAITLASNEPSARTAQMTFWVLKVITFAFCLFAGVRYTADALSEERREGTLGLLFLTDLRGYDVVIGKLAITSLNAFFGLLAALPLLSVPVMMGGISAGEVWRIMLVLVNTLFFSLAVALVVSAFGVQERNVLLSSLLWIVLATFGLPLCWELAAKLTTARWLEVLLLFPSPLYAFRLSASGLFVSVHSDFWPCMLTIAGISLVCVLTASLALPRVALEAVAASKEKPLSSSRGKRVFENDPARALAWRRWHLSQPYWWRVSRDPSMGRWCLLLAVVAAVFGMGSLLFLPEQGPRRAEPYIMFGWLAIHWIVKLLWTAEACRPFSEDKQCGALELLLCTPLQPGEMISAQRRRLKRIFFLPVAVVCLVSFFIATAIQDRMLGLFFTIGIFTLPADCWALRWSSMQFSLSSSSFTRAFFSALWRVMVPAWIGFFSIMVVLANASAQESTVRFCLSIWAIGVVIFDLGVTSWNRDVLATGFRRIASGDVSPRRKRLPRGFTGGSGQPATAFSIAARE